jgi:cytochrome b6-f complex iron-sulfur subunit
MNNGGSRAEQQTACSLATCEFLGAGPGAATSRRRALLLGSMAITGASAVAAVAYPIVRYLAFPRATYLDSPSVLQVCGAAELGLGGARVVLFASVPVIVLRRMDGSVHALSAECTHLGCTLRWDPVRDRLTCGCHSAAFDPATGRPLRGPASSPLTLLHAETRDGHILLSP